MSARFTHDDATAFAYQSASQILALVLAAGVVLGLTLRPLPPHAPGPRRG